MKIKSPSAKAKGLELSGSPDRTIFATFCMSDEIEKVYRKLAEIISIC